MRPQKFHSAEQEIQFIVGAVFSFEAEWVKFSAADDPSVSQSVFTIT